MRVIALDRVPSKEPFVFGQGNEACRTRWVRLLSKGASDMSLQNLERATDCPHHLGEQ